jgi:hypothetical protein
MCTVYARATLLLATFSAVEAKSSAGDLQGTAFTATWPAKTGNNPWSGLCIQTHANVPVYTMLVATLQGVGSVLSDIGYPHSALGKTCQELGFKELGFDRETCAEDPDCKPISGWLVDVSVWTNGAADATETLGKVIAHPNLISMLQEGHADSQASNNVTKTKSSAGVSLGVAFTTTWPKGDTAAGLCIQTHVNVPMYTMLVAALQATFWVIGDTTPPHSALGKTCQELGFKEFVIKEVDVSMWANSDAHATNTLGKVIAHPNLISMLQEGHTDSQASNNEVMV